MELTGATEIPTDLSWPKHIRTLSPDGETLIVFKSSDPITGYGNLVAIDLTTWITRQITYDDGMDYFFWSPDSRTIGFTMFGDSRGIWLMDVGRGEKHFFAEGDVATWSADGQRIAVANNIYGPSGEDLFVLRILDSDGRESEEVFQHEGGLVRHAGLAWSPDGRYIALAWRDPSMHGSMLYLLDLETREARPMMGKSYDIGRILGWTADGEWLVVDFAGGPGTTWFVHWDGACWVRPPELENMVWVDFSAQSAKALISQNYSYILDLHEAFGPDFPEGVLSCP